METNSSLILSEKAQKLKWSLSYGNLDTKVVITGSRDPIDYQLYKELVVPLLPKEPFQLISFFGFGLDENTQQLAKDYKYNIRFHASKWDKFGRTGGYIRNIEIVDFLNHFLKSEIIFLQNEYNFDLLTHLEDLCKNKDIKIKVVKVKV